MRSLLAQPHAASVTVAHRADVTTLRVFESRIQAQNVRVAELEKKRQDDTVEAARLQQALNDILNKAPVARNASGQGRKPRNPKFEVSYSCLDLCSNNHSSFDHHTKGASS